MTHAELLLNRAPTDQVVTWRREQLRRAGCGRAEAEILAECRDVDLHQAVELLERGCPAHLALEILL